MSKRSRARKHAATTAGETAPAVDANLGPDVLRRMLLAVLTGLIVARPFVRGEDPGLLSDFSDPGGMVLTLLTLAACAAWAGWQLWSRERTVYLGPVEVGLFGLVALYFLGAVWAPYQRAAFFTAAEWLGMVLLIFLARQLAGGAEEQQGLMAVLLATGMALVAQGLYQRTYELPHLARAGDTPEGAVLKERIAPRLIEPTPLEKHQLVDQLERRLVSGPFFHPTSLAACLVLLLPALVGAVVACARSKGPGWMQIFLGAGVGLAGLVFLMTRDVPAVLALVIVSLGAAGLYWPARAGGGKVGILLGLALGAAVAWIVFVAGALAADLDHWDAAWRPAWKLVEDHLWQGVGPSQFSFYYPRYMAVFDRYRLTDPSSGPLELISDVGIAGLVLVVLVLVLFFRTVVHWWRAGAARPPAVSGSPGPHPPAVSPGKTEPPIRWEYYLGGMLGALLSFLLRAGAAPGEEIIPEAVAAGLRSVAWFVAFGLFERVAWSAGEYVASLGVGIAAVLATLLVGPGLVYPSVASLLWLAVALVLALVAPVPAAQRGERSWVTAAVALPLFLGGALSYFVLIFYPAAIAANNTHMARLAGALFRIDTQMPTSRQKVGDPVDYVEQRILAPLRQADRDDPGNVRTRVLLSEWTGQQWRLMLRALSSKPNAAAQFNQAVTGLTAEQAVRWAGLARLANPEGPEGYKAEYDIRVFMAVVVGNVARSAQSAAEDKKRTPVEQAAARGRAREWREKQRQQYKLAAEALLAYQLRDPTNPELHYKIAVALRQAGNLRATQEQAQEQARKALTLNKDARMPRTLPDTHRQQLEQWLQKSSPR